MRALGEIFGPTCRTDQGPSRMHLVKYIDKYPSLTCFGEVGMADLGCNHNTKLSVRVPAQGLPGHSFVSQK